jgi:hypothetical protein
VRVPVLRPAEDRFSSVNKFLLGGYLLRQADEEGHVVQGIGFLPGNVSVSGHVEPVAFVQLSADLLDRGAGERVVSDQFIELRSLFKVDFAVVYDPVKGDTRGSRVNCSSLATGSVPRRSAGSLRPDESLRRHTGRRIPRGGSSCALRHRRCWPVTSSTRTVQ